VGAPEWRTRESGAPGIAASFLACISRGTRTLGVFRRWRGGCAAARTGRGGGPAIFASDRKGGSWDESRVHMSCPRGALRRASNEPTEVVGMLSCTCDAMDGEHEHVPVEIVE
jgi:hypothetical protein